MDHPPLTRAQLAQRQEDVALDDETHFEEWEKVKAARNLALARERARQRREHGSAVKQAAKDGLPAPAGPNAEVPF